jgi:enterochelin esterase family protein
VSFELTDRPGRLAAVRLVQEVGLAGPLEFARSGGRWQLSVAVPDVLRMEYLFEVEDYHHVRWTITDPANPRRVPGAFGEKSVLEFAGYRPPAWLAAPGVESRTAELEPAAPLLGQPVPATVWSPADLASGEPAPLLIVHDGPEYERLGAFTQYLAAGVAAGALPPLRAALLGPADRNGWYSASDAYADTLDAALFPVLDEVAPATVRIGVGVSLGALAMLHLHRRHPRRLHGLFLQSGSFFTPELDPQERGFAGFPAVTEFVAELHRTARARHPVPTVLTCGTVEENLANNEAMAATLHRLRYGAKLVTVRDAHNYTAWRDALDPHLTELVNGVVCARAA